MSSSIESSRAEFIAALRSGAEARARAVVDELRAAGVAPHAIYYELFAPSMVMIGDLWEQNELSVAEEHLATEITERLIGQLSPSFNQPLPQLERGSVVLGCVAGERHVLGLRMLADIFRQHGWRVLYLGADVPEADWVRLALRVDADAVAISVGAERLVPVAQHLIGQLQAVLPQAALLVGGAVFVRDPELWREVGATLYDPDPQTLVRLATAQFGVERQAETPE